MSFCSMRKNARTIQAQYHIVYVDGKTSLARLADAQHEPLCTSNDYTTMLF